MNIYAEICVQIFKRKRNVLTWNICIFFFRAIKWKKIMVNLISEKFYLSIFSVIYCWILYQNNRRYIRERNTFKFDNEKKKSNLPSINSMKFTSTSWALNKHDTWSNVKCSSWQREIYRTFSYSYKGYLLFSWFMEYCASRLNIH